MILMYLLIFIVLFAIMVLYLKVAKYYNIVDCPNHRSSHFVATLNGGGMIFYMGILVYSLCFGFHYPFLLIGLTLIAGISFVDDIRSVPRLPSISVSNVLAFTEFDS